MKKVLLTLLIFVGGIVMSPLSFADIDSHPNYNGLETLVDALIVNARVRQSTYFGIHKTYFHGRTVPDPALVTCDGVVSQEIDEGLHPHGQQAAWKDFDSEIYYKGAGLPIHLNITPYVGADGHGWILQVEFFYAGIDPDSEGRMGDHWVYKHHEGPGNPYGIFGRWYIKTEGP